MSGTPQERGQNGAPLVSVIIPTYNRWPLVAESIDSALAQDYPNLEVVVVDDGSTDDTEEQLPKRYPSKVRYFTQENRGPAAARNKGIQMALGEYVAFLDSDDLWMPNKLSVQVAAMTADEEWALAYNPCLITTPDGRNTGRIWGYTAQGVTGDNFVVLLNRHAIMTSAVIVRRGVFDEVGLFDEQMLSAQDTDLFLRITMLYPAGFINTPLTLFREHAGRWSHFVVPTKIRSRAHIYMYRKLLSNLPEARQSVRPLVQRSLLWAQFRLLQLEAEELNWMDFAGQLLEVYQGAEDLRWIHHLSAWTAIAINRWEHTHTPASVGQIRSLVEAIASKDERKGHTKNAWRACIYWGLGMRQLRRGQLRSALNYLSRGTLSHPPAAATHCACELARVARNARHATRDG